MARTIEEKKKQLEDLENQRVELYVHEQEEKARIKELEEKMKKEKEKSDTISRLKESQRNKELLRDQQMKEQEAKMFTNILVIGLGRKSLL